MKFKLSLLAIAMVATLSGCGSDGTDGTDGVDASQTTISLEQTARSASQGFDLSAAEIVAFDKQNDNVWVVNANSGQVDIFPVGICHYQAVLIWQPSLLKRQRKPIMAGLFF